MTYVRDPLVDSDDEWMSFFTDDRERAAHEFRIIRNLPIRHAIETQDKDGVAATFPESKIAPLMTATARRIATSQKADDAARITALLKENDGLTDMDILEILFGSNAAEKFQEMRSLIGTLYEISRSRKSVGKTKGRRRYKQVKPLLERKAGRYYLTEKP